MNAASLPQSPYVAGGGERSPSQSIARPLTPPSLPPRHAAQIDSGDLTLPPSLTAAASSSSSSSSSCSSAVAVPVPTVPGPGDFGYTQGRMGLSPAQQTRQFVQPRPVGGERLVVGEVVGGGGSSWGAPRFPLCAQLARQPPPPPPFVSSVRRESTAPRRTVWRARPWSSQASRGGGGWVGARRR